MKRISTDFQHHVDPTQLKIRGTNFYDLFFCHPLDKKIGLDKKVALVMTYRCASPEIALQSPSLHKKHSIY
jgi:hypothetical protein